jgi:DNA-binding SARP family transcriptional activator
MLELRTLGVMDLRAPGGAEVSAVLQQPKRFALLAYLAIGATGRFVRRDTLLGLFWPELDEHHARAALRRALYFLRQSAGEAVLRGRSEEEVGVPPEVLWCDVVAFRDALKAGEPARALELYQGDLLEGFYIAGAPGAEDWLDRERVRLRERALDAARALARKRGDPAEAARWARRALELDPANAEMRSLLDRLRQATSAPGSAAVPASAIPGSGASDSRLVAICPFVVRGGAGLTFLSEGMVDLLATKLDGAGDLRVVEPRLVLSGAGGAPGDWNIARGQWLAGRAGAGSFVLGSVVEVAGRLEATAALHGADGDLLVRVEGRATGETELFELVDELARGLLAGRLATTGDHLASLAARTTESLPALKAWLDGERVFRLARHLEAADAFRRATDADPSFALAWYRLAGALAASALIEPARDASRQAHRHRERLSEHDRSLLEAQHAWITGLGAEAERRYAALVTAWPESLEGWFLLGDVQVHSNPYRGRSAARAREAFERALALDPEHLGAVLQLARIAAMEHRGEDLDRLVDRALALSPTGDQAIGLRSLRAWALDRTAEQAELTGGLAAARGLTIARAFSDVALYGGDLARAERLGRDLFASARSEEFRAFGHVTLAHLALARGRVVEAFDRLREAEKQDPAWAMETRGLFAALPFVALTREQRTQIRDELARWDPASARVAVAIPLAFHNELHALLRAFLLGLLAVRVGDLDAAVLDAETLAELPVPAGAEALLQHLGRTLGAELLRARGAPLEALAVLEQGRLDVWFQYAVASPFFAGTYERFLRADLLAEAGRFPEALGWWGAIAERTPFELPFLAPALQRESETWQRLGDDERARICAERARALWGDGPA